MMRSKIEKLSARIEALVAASEGGVPYVWRDRGQTDIEACERHYQFRPEDRNASLTYIIGWVEGE
jgi:hypothetical protein